MSRHVNIVPSDNIGDSNVVENVRIHSEISSVIEDTSIDSCPPIYNEIPMCSEITVDVVEALVDSSIRIPDETYVHEDNQGSQETKSDSIVATSSIFSFTQSLEFLYMIHHVSSSAFAFSECLDFSFEFLQISVVCNNIIPLAVSEVHPPRKPMPLFPISL